MNLAIKGHLSRGKEVIEILEMLGGINLRRLEGTDRNSYYTIDNDGNILGINTYLCNHVHDTLEEFLEKYPYKVGDKVQHKGATSCGTVYEIEQMVWEDNQVKYIICDLYWKVNKCIVTAEHLQPYKEETMEEKIQAYEITGEFCANEVAIEFDPSKFEMIERNGKYFVVKKQPQYPKTYKECCEVLMGKTDFQDFELVLTKLSINQAQSGINIFSPVPPHITLINNFYKLLICRDAYWRMAGDWKYDVNKIEDYFLIVNKCGRIVKEHYMSFNHILAFPTAEMRDTFFKNFKDLIEICKELL